MGICSNAMRKTDNEVLRFAALYNRAIVFIVIALNYENYIT